MLAPQNIKRTGISMTMYKNYCRDGVIVLVYSYSYSSTSTF